MQKKRLTTNARLASPASGEVRQKRLAKRAKRTKLYSKVSADTLLPTDQIIKLAKDAGVAFGPGNPAERIRYFIKLGILPHMVRKLPDPDALHPEGGVAPAAHPRGVSNSPATPVGHLPYSSVKTLAKVDRLFRSGLSYPKIAQKLKQQEEKGKPIVGSPSGVRLKTSESAKNRLPSGTWPNITLFPKLGISEKHLSQKLKEQEKNIASILEKKFESLTLPGQDLQAELGKIGKPGKLSFALKGLVTATTLTGLLATGIYSGRNYYEKIKEPQSVSEDIEKSSDLVGQVLAATSDQHRLYIDADTEVSGTTLFLEDITAPNIIYSVSGGTGIKVAGGQRPIVSLDETEIVTSVNDLAGDVVLKASGAISLSKSDQNITFSSSALTSEADTLSTVTGRGATTSTALTLNGAVSLGSTLSFSSTDSTINITNTGSIAFKDSTNTLFSIVDQGAFGTIRLSDKGSTGNPSTCTAGDIYFNGTDASVSACTATNTWEALDASGSNFVLAGDAGTNQTVSGGDTLTVTGGTGITTTASATDTLTVDFTSTEVGSTTWGSGSTFTWTFNAGATDPTIAFASDQITLGAATLVLSGTTTITASSLTTITGAATAIDFTEFDVSSTTGSVTINDGGDAGNISIEGTVLDINSLDFVGVGTVTTATGDLTLNPTDEVVFGDTDTLIIGGHAGNVAYNVISDSGGSPGNSSVDSDDDLYVEGFVEIDGGLQVDGTITGSTTFNCTDCINADDLADNIDLTAATETSLTFTTASSNTIVLQQPTAAAGIFDVNLSSSTSNVRGADIATTFTGTADTNVAYGLYNAVSSSQVLATTVGQTFFGQYNNVTKTGADTTSGTIATYGIYTAASNTGGDTAATRNTYGGFFSAAGDANGTTNAYGVYASTTSAVDTNYALYATASGGTTNYGLYVAAGNVYLGASTVTTGLTASRFVTTDASSNLATTGTSAFLTNTLSDETGSGFAVFATSPQLTTSITTDSTTFALVNTTATTINFAGAATTALNIGNGNTAYTAINIGSGTGGNVINLAGTGATGADTINIGTGGTSADIINIGTGATANTIAIGSSSSTSVSVTDDNWSISTAGLITTADDAAINGGDITTTAATFNVANAATTLNLGSTNVTRAINVGTGTNADTIAIGTGGTNADTITIGTGAVANSITIGTTTASASVAINDDNWNITGAGAANFVSIGATTAGTGAFTTLSATPASTNDITLTTDADSTLIISGLQSSSGTTLCVDGSSNVVTCTASTATNVAWSGLTNPSGSLSLTFDDAEVNTFTVSSDTEDFWTFTANSLTSGDLFDISATALTSGSLFKFTGSTTTGITGPAVSLTSDIGSAGRLIGLAPDFSGSAVTGYGIYQAATDATTAANIDYGLYSSLALTNAAGKTGYGLYSTVTSTSTTADTLLGQDILVDHNTASASGNKTLYGLRSQVTNDGITDAAGTHNLYGGYFSTIGNTGGTQNAFAIYAAATGADNNYAAVFNGGNIGINETAPSNLIDITFSGTTTNAWDITTSTVTTGDVLHLLSSSTSATESDLVDAAHQATYTSTTTVNGNILDLDRDLTGSGVTLTVDGPLAIFTDLCSGTCTYTSNANVLRLEQTFASSTIAVLKISNSGTGADIALDNDETISNTTDGTITFGVGGSAEVNLTATAVSPATAEGNALGTTSAEWEVLYLGDDKGIFFGLDQDFSLAYDQLTDNRLELVYPAAGVFTLDASTTANESIAGALDLNVTSATTNNRGIDLSYTFNSTTASAVGYGQYNLYTHSNTSLTTSNTLYGQYHTLVDSTALANTNFGIAVYGNVTGDGAVTKTSYGVYSDVLSDNTTTDQGTRNTYGGYFSARGSTRGTNTAYGIYATASGGDNNYGINIAGLTGAGTTNYGLVLDAVSGATNNYNLFSSSANPRFFLESTASTTITGVLDLNVTSATTDNRGIDLSYTFNSTTANAIGYGLYGLLTHSNASLTTTNTLVGQYLRFSDTTNLANTNYGIYVYMPITGNAAKDTMGIYGGVSSNSTTADTLYGGYFTSDAASNAARTANYGAIAYGNTSSTTADSVYGLYGATVASGAVSSGTRNQYGLYGIATASGAVSTATSNTYGGIFNAVVTAGTATENAYGIYSKASGGDNNYGLYLAGSTPYSLYIDTTVTTTASAQAAIKTAGTVTIDTTNESFYAFLYDSTINIDVNPGTFGTMFTFRGSEDYVIDSAVNNTTGVITFSAAPTVSVSGTDIATRTWDILEGFRAGLILGNTGSGTTALTVTKARGAYVTGTTIPANTTVTDLYGLQVDNTAPTGTLTRQYGVYIDNLTGGASDYGIYVAGAGDYAAWLNGRVTLDLWTDTSDEALCGEDADADTTDVDINDCTGAPAADYAEIYPTAQDVEFKDLLVTGSKIVTYKGLDLEGNIIEDGSNPENSVELVKSSTPYDPRIIGVASNNYGDFSSTGHNRIEESDHPLPVSLSGRVKVKVTDEGGPIAVGDLLTTSSTPAHAMRADPTKGSTFGKALASFSGPGTGEILVFIEINTRYNLAKALEELDLKAQTLTTSSITLSGNILTDDLLGLDGTLKEEYKNQVLTAEQVQRLVEIEVEKQIGRLLASSQASGSSSQLESPVPQDPSDTPDVNQVDTSGVGTSGSPDATNSAQPADETTSDLAQDAQETLDAMNDLLSTTDLNIDTLTVSGNTNLAQTQVAGTFSQDGTLIIDYGRQINVLGSTLYLQNDPYAGCPSLERTLLAREGESLSGCQADTLVDIGNGKAIIDKLGNLKIAGELNAKRLTTREIEIDVADTASQTVGSSLIDTGSSAKTIFTTALKPNAKILITPTTPTGGRTIYVSAKADFEGFTVALDPASPTPTDIQFDWLIVNTSLQSKL